jgi:xanthine dehydrogenase accessory factor
MLAEQRFFDLLLHHPAVWVTVVAHRGSVPRHADAWMAVFADACVGTVGGGQLEWQAQREARQRLHAASPVAVLRYPLGPKLDQCCGGEVHLRFERVDAGHIPVLRAHFERQRQHWPVVAVFGAGHVGAALVRLLVRLPLRVLWRDARVGSAEFVAPPPPELACQAFDSPDVAVVQLPAGAQVLVLTHSHALDYALVQACLQRQRTQADLCSIGLIGSRSKWASFASRLRAVGWSAQELAGVTCPIGLPGIHGREPEVIAVSVAAQLLQAAGANHAAGDADYNKDV